MSSGLFSTGRYVIEAKTASYKMVPEDENKIFTNRGAGGAVVLTLPTTAKIPIGWAVKVFSMAAQDLTINALAADTMITYDDLDADGIAFTTAGDEIGNGAEFVWDGTSWLAFLMIEGAVVATVTT